MVVPRINILNFFRRLFHEKLRGGTNFYFTDAMNNSDYSNMEYAVNHPILTPAILFLSKIYSQAEFYIENKDTKEKIYDHELLELLKRPNSYQNQDDFLNTVMFAKIANGSAVLYKKVAIGFENTDSLYILDYNLIDFGEDFKTPMNFKSQNSKFLNKYVIYDESGVNLKIKLKDLIFINDLPNGVNTNILDVTSRIDGLHQTLDNTQESLVAKHTILQTNGRDLITTNGNQNSFPLDDPEKENVEGLMQGKYGLGRGRLRTIITRADLNWKSMHIALRDLGFDESIKTDANIIYTALHIPKDILSLEAKKIKYNNFRESMVSFLQNQMQSDIDYLCRKLGIGYGLDSKLVLRGSFEHMPVMKTTLKEKYEGIELRGKALISLLDAGIPDEIALRECDFDTNITLNRHEKKTK